MTSSAGAHAPFDSRDVHVGQDVGGRDVHGRRRRRGALPRRHRRRRSARRHRAGPALPLRGVPRPVVVPAEPDRQPARAPGVGALPPDARRRRRALARHGRRALPQAQPRLRRRGGALDDARRPLAAAQPDAPELPRRGAGGGRRGRQGPRAPRRSSLRPAGRRRRAARAARAHGHARDVRGVLGPEPQLPHRSRDGAGARLSRHRRPGNAVGVLRRRRDGAALRRRLAARRHARRPPGQRRLARRHDLHHRAWCARSCRRARASASWSTSGARRPTATVTIIGTASALGRRSHV